MPPLKKQPLEDIPKEEQKPLLTVDEIMDEELEKVQFEEFKKMDKPKITNDQIYDHIVNLGHLLHQNNKDILDNKKEIIKASKEDYDLSIHAITELHYLKKHFTKISVLVILLVFVCGTGFGTLYESWLPYVDTLIDFFKITNQVSKGV